MRDHIVNEIRRLAALAGGRPPGQIAFAKETGIAEHHWRGQFWARWGDALAEAGYPPNARTGRLSSESVLDKIIHACRAYGRLPTKAEMQLCHKDDPSFPSVNTIRRHFGSQDEWILALRRRAAERDDLADVLALLPETLPTRPAPTYRKSKSDGYVYLIKSGDFYKIGRSDNLERRVKEISIALPDPATLIHIIRTDDPAGIETYWHKRFKERRANGEWFKLSGAELAAFKKRKYQ